ncbi:MAG: GNAT family N-acetyltransferase [Wenzhouxiangellaceae bacterium]
MTCSEEIRLRHCALDDLKLLREWDRQPHLRESIGDDDWNWAGELGRVVPWREMLIAEFSGRPIGFVQIIDCREEESHYWGTDCPERSRAIDLWIGEPDQLRKGRGTEIMRQALARCFDDPDVPCVLIDPMLTNTAAHAFYQSLGFQSIGPRDFGNDHCMVFELTRDVWRQHQS